MRALIFDPFSGCAGDMILGALVSAGVTLDELRSGLAGLSLSGYELNAAPVTRHGISGVKVAVTTAGGESHRNLEAIRHVIDKSRLSERVRNRAQKIFQRLAEAEARIHGTEPGQVHFHEVGAVDAIVDIVGACCGIESLNVERIYSRAISLGGSSVRGGHGVIPLPAPAVTELTKGFPVRLIDCPTELTTPTGAAIITTLAEPISDQSEFKIEAVGYGAGDRDPEQLPNLLRVMIVELGADYETDFLVSIETNIDNLNPEIYSFLFDGLFELGAREVYTTPVGMKKSRPGVLLTVLCDPPQRDRLAGFLFANSTTSGLRFSTMQRLKLPRTSECMTTSLGKIHVKIYEHEGRKRITPEYEDVKKLALEHKIGIIDLYHRLQIELDEIKER